MAGKHPLDLPFGVLAKFLFPIASPLVPAPAGVLVPELRTARENARLETGSQRGQNSHQIGVLGIYDLQGLSYDRTELLVAGMRLLAPDPSGSPPAGRCQSMAIYAQPRHERCG